MHRLISRVALAALFAGLQACGGGADTDEELPFQAIVDRFVDESTALSPVSATSLGDHRYDGLLDDVSAEARAKELAFIERYIDQLEGVDREELIPDEQVDAEMLRHELEYRKWQLTTLEEWAWNPLLYVQTPGTGVYALLARDFAPLPERLANVASRLEALPVFFSQARAALDAARVPKVHAETAVRQTPGILSMIEQVVEPELNGLEPELKERLTAAIAIAREAIAEQQRWLEEELVPNAEGDFRIGAELFDQKLAFTLHTPLGRAEIASRAAQEYRRVRDQMYQAAREVYAAKFPRTEFPDTPGEAYKQTIIRYALEQAYAQIPGRDEIVDAAKRTLEETTEFVTANNLITLPDDPVEIIIMPEFRRGVAVAYCDSPGPLDRGQKTFYAVAPLPEDWTVEQVNSFLREYNVLSLYDLTIHEAMPGHFVQLAISNQHPSVLRALLASGPFIEGWAVYAERMMIDAGFKEDDPLMRLINLKWYLRVITNAMIDQAIHVDGMTEQEAMQLMIEGGFQEEREAAGKWTRAQLTSAQLSTYFVGYQEIEDLKSSAEQAWGDEFSLKRFHDTVLSFGSPPGQFVRALMLGEPVPQG